MVDDQGSPVFADRYRFEPVDLDWDVGRSGYTHLVYDLKKNRFGVIKRAEINSKQAVELKIEIEALKALKGFGVPEVYETGQTIYGSKSYEYVVLEYVEATRIEKNLGALSKTERVEILLQFFSLLARAHNQGIVNGDIDLKHLFWRRDKRLLVVIDWGNAKIKTDIKNKAEFAYDLARSAEIIYSLTTDKGHPPATGPLSLPGASALIPGLSPLPDEYTELCQWAPRKPLEGIKAPVTALELLEATKHWGNVISGKAHQKTPSVQPGIRMRVWASMLVFVFIAAVIFFERDSLLKLISPPNSTATMLQVATITQTPAEKTPSATIVTPPSTSTPTVTATLTETPTATSTPVMPMPTPRTYDAASALVFDNKLVLPNNNICWKTDTELTLTVNEGFYRRDNRYWGFRISENENTIPEERPVDTPVYVDFSQCLEDKQLHGLGLNAWITKIVPERDNPTYAPGTIDPGREFGIFIENEDGVKREYTLWIDKNRALHLQVREKNVVIYDNSELVVSSIQTGGVFPRPYNKFFIQIFLEIDNNGLDAIYLLQGSGSAVEADSLDPTKMFLKSTLPTFGNIQKLGLVGYGGETQVLIWPLAFFK